MKKVIKWDKKDDTFTLVKRKGQTEWICKIQKRCIEQNIRSVDMLQQGQEIT